MIELRLGIAGTAKNTGKTTATAAIIKELRNRGVGFYLTSIGYDGENIDNVTGLPKPKLRVEAGDIVASAEQCFRASTAGFEMLRKTEIGTPLGKIAVARVTNSGLAVTAGPNKSGEVRILAGLLSRLGPGVTLFDGALNRIAPMVETDGFLLATGASRTPDIPRLARETAAIWRLSALPAVPGAAEINRLGLKEVTLLSGNLREIKKWPKSSLLGAEDIRPLLTGSFGPDGYLFIPGLISETAMIALAEGLRQQPARRRFLAIADPIKLLVGGNPLTYYELVQSMERLGVFVGVLRRVPLLAVTINPFYPEYRLEQQIYKPAFVDPVRLQTAVRNAVQVPVFNVVQDGVGRLVDMVLANGHRWEHPDVVRFDQ